MSEFERIRLGTERRRRETRRPGQYVDGDTVINASVEFTVEVVEHYHFKWPLIRDGAIDWWPKSTDWTTMQVDGSMRLPPPEPVPKIPWWRRLFGLGPRLPKMKVVSQ